MDYYYLMNKKVPKETWIKVAKSHRYSKPLTYDENSLYADVDETSDLRNFIGCILALLRLGYKYDIDFEFSSAA